MSRTLARQLQMTVEQVQKRDAMGDQLHSPRKVDHTAKFWRAPDAAGAVDDLTKLGYEAESHRGLFRSTVTFTHVTPVDIDTAERFVREVLHVVEARGGNYDGWGGEVVD